jgi:hypothetical protein
MLPAVASGPPAPTAPAPARESTAATKRVVHAEVEVGQTPGAGAAAPPLGGSAPSGRRRRGLAVVLVAVAAGAAGGGLWLARGALGTASPAAAPPSPVVVVAEQGHVAVEGAAVATAAAPGPPVTPAPTPPSSIAPAVAPPQLVRAAPAPSAPRSRRPAETASAARGESFSATLSRREGDIRRCFNNHPGGTSTATEISLRFDVDREGRVTSLAVLPAAIGASPLGSCLAAVGKTTLFARQAAPVSFRIPLTVQRETAGKNGR